MKPDNQDKGQLDIADHRKPSCFQQNSQYFPHHPSHHHSSPRTPTVNLTSITVAFTELDTDSKSELLNVSIPMFLSLLQFTVGKIDVQKVLNIVQDLNIDANMCSHQISFMQHCHAIASSTVRNEYNNSLYAIKTHDLFLTYISTRTR